MGHLVYGHDKFEIEDRLLAHLQHVIVAKLRKQEAFLCSWTVEPAQGSGQIAIWIDAGLPLTFRFDGSRPISINRTWLNAMVERSYTTAGLELMPESEYPETPAS
ncbi:hypothetical protein KXS11_17040 [Plantibacter flavus]|uniref:DUF7882 family protein n=1 Tax=Plantibacter flavus TaxID=150123 RepID=UPI003F186BA3